jgi:ceramide glucosyltransferase
MQDRYPIWDHVTRYANAYPIYLSALGIWLIWIAASSAASLIAWWRSRVATALSSPPAAEGHPQLTLLRPCSGAEVGLVDRLVHVGGASHVRFLLDNPDDAAAPAAMAAALALQTQGIDAKVTYTRAQGLNHKASQLACALDDVDTNILACVDSDVDLRDRNFLAELGAFEREPDLAAVWYAAIELGEWHKAGDIATAGVLSASLHAFPLLGRLDAQGLVGKAMLIRRSALVAAGGFAALTTVLGEDMQLASNLRAIGMRTRLAPGVLAAYGTGRSLTASAQRFTRWIWVIRAQRARLMLSYPLLLAALPLQCAYAIGLALAAPVGHLPVGQNSSIIALVNIGLLILMIVRALLVARVHRLAVALGATKSLLRWSAAALLGDVVLLAAFGLALGPRRVRWRNRALTIGRNGHLCAVQDRR